MQKPCAVYNQKDSDRDGGSQDTDADGQVRSSDAAHSFINFFIHFENISFLLRERQRIVSGKVIGLQYQ